MEREEIYEQLREITPFLKRHYATPRIQEESGMNFLLDQLLELDRIELKQFEEDYERDTER